MITNDVRAPSMSRPGRDGRASRSAAATPEDQVLVTRTGLRIPLDLSYERWEQAGRRISDVMDSSAWCLGDWIVFGESHYGDRYRRAIDALGLRYQTLRNYAWVARRFEPGQRRPTVSFQHHAEVAALPPVEQDCWLDLTERHGWSRNELRAQVRDARGKSISANRLPVPQIKAEREQIELWRVAAQRSDDSLESWIVSALNAAASDVLGYDIQPIPD